MRGEGAKNNRVTKKTEFQIYNICWLFQIFFLWVCVFVIIFVIVFVFVYSSSLFYFLIAIVVSLQNIQGVPKKRTFRIIIAVLQSIQAHKPGLQAPSSLGGSL